SIPTTTMTDVKISSSTMITEPGIDDRYRMMLPPAYSRARKYISITLSIWEYPRFLSRWCIWLLSALKRDTLLRYRRRAENAISMKGTARMMIGKNRDMSVMFLKPISETTASTKPRSIAPLSPRNIDAAWKL